MKKLYVYSSCWLYINICILEEGRLDRRTEREIMQLVQCYVRSPGNAGNRSHLLSISVL